MSFGRVFSCLLYVFNGSERLSKSKVSVRSTLIRKSNISKELSLLSHIYLTPFVTEPVGMKDER